MESENSKINVGDKVRVKVSVNRPRYNWGDVSHKSIGTVKKLDETGEMRIDFPEMRDWMGIVSEMEVVPSTPPPSKKSSSGASVDVEGEIYECAVCLTLMVNNNPRLLQCSHTFCEQCIKKLMKEDQVTCPTCREYTTVISGDVSRLKINFGLVQLAEREMELATKFQTQCQICFKRSVKVEATVRCHQCFRMMCDACNLVHSKVKAYNNHLVVDINKKEMGTDTCKEHKLPITYVCNACEFGLCVDCTFETAHIEHLDEIEEFETGVANHRELIRTLTVDVKDILVKLKEMHAMAEDGTVIVGQIKQNINNKAQSLKDQIDREAEELMDNIKDNRKMYVTNALKPVLEAIDKMTAGSKELQNLDQENDYDFIYHFKEKREATVETRTESETVLKADFIIPKLIPPKDGSDKLLGTLE